ncbi:type I methionyl aminopeptidase [Helicobacter mustelae]|uniref:Methionine aminopeptidase n=1 Tax=Helicobacter mustelae (strain ATCC 43772 / CCUG 25715 / CIP 103759 / LMG 18044 / NCTC 12198 / R85-136P) TaxID=679897 RepID=D3UIG9_HELM1|nr:type I methionyl aminopeptidase [Helicobacter mustelae]CBG40292.1 methionine aminopeptidase [Helicobacter mustelae 12198]SQH71792.1 methionine aminopeptidase [Helicobacter mustelae]STP12921.1 methionine aminopeptidase [Helicobacter mustelae]
MAIPIRNASEIELLRRPNALVGEALKHVRDFIKPGISLLEIDALIEDFIRAHGARPAFKGLYGFPNSACISVNEVIIHGIPTDYKLQNGDIVGIDVGAEIGGWYGDGAITMGVGEISALDIQLIDCARDTLINAIHSIKEGMYFKELSKILEENICARGFVPLKHYCGHGIGRKPHDEPSIPNYLESSNFKQGPKIKNGMVFCLEPMVCVKSGEPVVLENQWDVVSSDGFRGSHYEHTVAIVGGVAEILTEV